MKTSLLLLLLCVLFIAAPSVHAQDTSYWCSVLGQASSQDCPAYNICYQLMQNYNTQWAFCDGQGFFCYAAAWFEFNNGWSNYGCGGCMGCIVKNEKRGESPLDRGRYYALTRPNFLVAQRVIG